VGTLSLRPEVNSDFTGRLLKPVVFPILIVFRTARAAAGGAGCADRQGRGQQGDHHLAQSDDAQDDQRDAQKNGPEPVPAQGVEVVTQLRDERTFKTLRVVETFHHKG